MSDFSELIGKTLVSCDAKRYGEQVRFETESGERYRMYHSQDCCENVYLEDICGDISDLIGSPIIQAEESTNKDVVENTEASQHDSFTWTFYRIATAKGQVVLRWYGESNGWYAEDVSFIQTI
jgi:hypothetical protein